MRRVAVVLVALAALAGCGSDGGSEATDDGSSADAGTSLTIVVTPADDVEPSTYELTCDPAGGDHPQAAEACKALGAAGADVFEPVPDDQACTMIFGGPQKATVTGTYDGQTVDASFSRENGCEIERWETLGTTFFNVPLQ